MHRRAFLAALGAGLAAARTSRMLAQPAGGATKNWAWMPPKLPGADEWRRQLATLKQGGIDAILIGGNADFYRKVIPAATAEGIEVHAWQFTMMRGENVAAHPEWYAVSRKGVSTATKPPYVDYYKFMCPSRDEVRAYVRGVMREIAQVEGLASVHLDYIRYPDVILPIALWPKYNLVQDREHPEFDFCYCTVCRERFKKQAGVDPLELADPPAHREWLQFRYDTITSLVNAIAGDVHAAKKKLTAAVFPTPAIAKALVRQEWTKWDLDAVLPMLYNGFYKEDVAWVERGTREGVQALAGRIPLYAGLYVPDLKPADLARAAEHAFAGGARGVSVFEGQMLTPEHWKALTPVLRRHARA
jgi:uncharacterized lipoprotein YddW (UPF0748 family)